MLIVTGAVWQYQLHSTAMPADPTTITVPSAGWTAGGITPFGHTPSLPVPDVVVTNWTVNTGLWISRNVTVDGLAGLLLKGRVENACLVYFDGTFIGEVNPTNADLADDYFWHVVIPSALATSGTHQIAVMCFDEVGGGDGNTYINVTCDYVPPFLTTQPQAPAKETLEWLTDLTPAKDGTEAPLQLRTAPRQTFDFTYPRSAADQALAFNKVWGARHVDWLVPVWPQSQLLGAVSAGLLTIPNVLSAEYRRSSLVLLWQDKDTWQLLAIDQLSGTNLILRQKTSAFSNAQLMPVRFAQLLSDPTKVFTGYNASFELVFQVKDNQALTVSAPTQYLGNDLYTDQTLLDGATSSDNITGNFDLLDESTGKIGFYQNWANAKVARNRNILASGQSEAWALRQWFHRRAGKYVKFWEPSFEADLRVLSTGTVTTALNVSADDYQKRASARTHIAVEYSGGWLVRAITASILTSPGVVQLTLDTALSIAASDIRRVCWLGLKRLNTDSVELDWIGGGVCQTQVRTLETSP